jgi:hypothetical protein
MQRGSLQVSALHKSTKIRQLCVCVYTCVHIYIYMCICMYIQLYIYMQNMCIIYIYYIYICTDSMILCVYMNVSKCVRASVLVAWLAKNSPKAMPGASACDFLPPCHWGTIRIIPFWKMWFKHVQTDLHTLGQSNMAMENARFIGWFSLIFRVKHQLEWISQLAMSD